MRFIGIGGEPATGKSTLMRAFIRRLPGTTVEAFSFGKVKGRYYASLGLWLIGVYDGRPFPGTDRLSMAVQPDFDCFLRQVAERRETVLFEGDRLFIQKNFDLAAVLGFQVTALFLEASKTLLDQRHKDRADSQTEQFLSGRATKYRKLKDSIPGAIVRRNENREDQDRSLNLLATLIADPGVTFDTGSKVSYQQ